MTEQTRHNVEGFEILSADDMANIREALFELARIHRNLARDFPEQSEYHLRRAAEVHATEVKTHSIYVDGE